MLCSIIVLVIINEAITNLVIKSDIFKPIRGVMSFNAWTEDLFSCGYCFSVWSAAALMIAAQVIDQISLTGTWYVDIMIGTILVHRLSNILHNMIDKFTDKSYDVRFAVYKNTE